MPNACSARRQRLCGVRARCSVSLGVSPCATILVSTPLTPPCRSPTPEVAAASMGTVRPRAQCPRTVFVPFLLDPVLVRVRAQLLHDLVAFPPSL